MARTIFLYYHSQIARATALFARKEWLRKQFSDCDGKKVFS